MRTFATIMVAFAVMAAAPAAAKKDLPGFGPDEWTWKATGKASVIDGDTLDLRRRQPWPIEPVQGRIRGRMPIVLTLSAIGGGHLGNPG